MKGSNSRMVEMRLVCFTGGVIGTRVLLLNDIDTQTQVVSLSPFVFLIACLLTLLFSTWLDYFPSRLQDITFRRANGQSIATGCLLPASVCCGVFHMAYQHAPNLLGCLSLYLILLSVLCFVSILSTVVHAIPYPNSIVMYNLGTLLICYLIYTYTQVPLLPLLVGVAIYSVLVPSLLYRFPGSFSIGEVIIVGQGLTLLILDVLLQLASQFKLIKLSPELSFIHRPSVLYVELLTFGVLLCVVLLLPVLWKIVSSPAQETRLWSATFLLGSLTIGWLVVLPCLKALLGGRHPFAVTIYAVVGRQHTLLLTLCWSLLCMGAGLLVCAQTSSSPWLMALKSNKPSSLWMRKWFHILAFLVYAVGVAVDADFLGLAAAHMTFVFLVLELMRVLLMWPIGQWLHDVLEPFLDARDSGPLVLTHLYLLLGFSIPVWLYPLSYSGAAASKLALYAGVVSLGVGDSIASVAGKLMGKHKWPGTQKTLEGSLMAFFMQMITIAMVIFIDPGLNSFSYVQWIVVGVSVTMTTLLEAYTQQIDNLILGPFLFTLLIAFL
eukprot:Em0018g52a